MSRLALCGALALVTLAGCGKSPQPAAPAPARAAVAVSPSDPKLARLYEQTCKACHTNPSTGAPQAGDRAAWEPRLAQGMDRVLDHVVNGYKGMPPLGSCQDCSEAEFKALIEFMARQ